MSDTSQLITQNVRSAVEMLRESNYDASINSLRCALDDLSSSVPRDLASNGRGCEALKIEAAPLRLQNNRASLPEACRSEQSAGLLMIYSCLFQFPEGTFDELLSCPENVSRATAVVVYNLALAFHLRGLSGLDQEKNLRSALKLYKVAFGTLFDQGGCHSDFEKIISLAILNNKGHIHWELFEMESVKDCMNWIKSLLHSCYEEESTTDLRAFSFIVVLWECQLGLPASPAA